MLDPQTLLRDVTSEVPEIWIQAAAFSRLFSFELANRRQQQPFDERFSLDVSSAWGGGVMSSEAVAHVVHYVRTVHTSQCYGVRRSCYARRTKNRESMDCDDQHRWAFTSNHVERLVAIAKLTGVSYHDIKRLDRAIRERRAQWDPLKTITTPLSLNSCGGRSFLHVKAWDRWIDVSYVGDTPALSSSLS